MNMLTMDKTLLVTSVLQQAGPTEGNSAIDRFSASVAGRQ
jgi:hypothetical protein